jgi:hypothetical protein
MLKGRRPTLGEFIDTDDTVIIAALKCWSRSPADPVLQYLAKALLERRLFKEIRFENAQTETIRMSAQSAVKEALARQTASDLPTIDAEDKQALDYFVLVDTCAFKTFGHFDGILFDAGGATPKTFDELRSQPEYDLGQRKFDRTRIFVPSDVVGSVKAALRELEGI